MMTMGDEALYYSDAERQAQAEMAEFILKYWKTQQEEHEEDMQDGTEKVI